jgi:predicted amidophosphoribosyltransferase
VYWAGRYQGDLRRAILEYKYREDRSWAPVFARQLAAFLRRHATWFEEDAMLCPVPSFAGRNARRRWSPVGLVCDELARELGPTWGIERLLVKRAETVPMSRCDGRRRELSGDRHILEATALAPGVPSGALDGLRVVLVDDVCASGHTLLACARALRRAGAQEVTGLVLARAFLAPGRVPGPLPAAGVPTSP